MIVYHCFLLGVLYHSYLLGETAAGMEGVDRDFVMVECGTLRLRGASSSVESPLWPDIVVSPSCERDFWKDIRNSLCHNIKDFFWHFSMLFTFFNYCLLWIYSDFLFFIFFLKREGCSTQQRKSFSSFMTRISKFEEKLNSDFREQFFQIRIQNNDLSVFLIVNWDRCD